MGLILLDRDGVINEDSDNYIKSLQEWHPIPKSIHAIAQLNRAGYKVAIVTNQSGLNRGLFTEKELNEIHEQLLYLVHKAGGKIDSIVWCPHHPDEHCCCRKPKTGLIEQVEKKLGLSAKNSWFVGDSIKDIQTAFAAQCKPALVLSGKGSTTFDWLKNTEHIKTVPVFENLAAFVDHLIEEF